MSAVGASNRISYLLGLLGPSLLLPWSTGSKGGRRKWKHLQLTDMDELSYQIKLERAANIGVALGQVSNGLITIDLDQDSYVEALLAANPLLMNTLQTRAARGCNIWVRCSCGYPNSQKLKNEFGTEIGEWRADGNQTIIAGTHPEGMPYQFVVEKPVMTIGYEAIIWPDSILLPRATESTRVRGVGENKVAGLCVCGASLGLERVGDLISQIAPKGFRQNNGSLFKLARLVKGCEDAVGRRATVKELEVVFEHWSLVARTFWRHTRDDYWAEFLQARHYALVGLDQDPLEVALHRARTMPLPEVAGFSDERVRLLAAICRELEQQVRGGSFYLPTRKLGTLLCAHWGTVARWLIALETLGVIRLAPGEKRKPGGNRCPRYQYGQPTRETETLSTVEAGVEKRLRNASPASCGFA
jgi:Bifunctional DNA primase/polymerase, N-terminal